MIKIAILTATRAEYGLLRQIVFKMRDDPEIDFNLLVTGTHLSKEFGMTVDEIKKDNVPIATEIDIIEIDSEGEVNVVKTMANAIAKFGDYFSKNRYDLLFVDGDRYETLAVCIAAILNNIPIAHCGGGSTTEGANDEFWRHAITKLSYLHFPTMQIYANRIIRMGEEPDRVFVCGSPGLENIRVMQMASREEIERKLKFKLDMPYALVTFHPVTLEDSTAEYEIKELLSACELTDDMKFIFTKSNADKDGQIINRLLDDYADNHKESCICVSSLGAYYYLSAMKYCEFVLGNSSSGIIETPSFGIPTVNIGDRQRGRERAKSIIDCQPDSQSILKAISKARDKKFREFCKAVINPNGDGFTSDRIIEIIKEKYRTGLSMKKHFYDSKEN